MVAWCEPIGVFVMFRQPTWFCVLIVLGLPWLIPVKVRDIREKRIIEGADPGAVRFTATIIGTFTDEIPAAKRSNTRHWIRWKDDAGQIGQTMVPPDFAPRGRVDLIRLPDFLKPDREQEAVYYDPRYDSSTFEIGILVVVVAAIVYAAIVLIRRFVHRIKPLTDNP